MAKRTHATVAVASQVPWIVNRTLFENVVFGKTYNHERYQKVIKACKLDVDLEALPGGDQCEIGEKGINLRLVFHTLVYFILSRMLPLI
jgi:ABC-type multidrug transport system fused ATPase/permease subunit